MAPMTDDYLRDGAGQRQLQNVHPLPTGTALPAEYLRDVC
jgi:hypothetical protein